jgi:uncharacterized protein (TIGR02679 family)
MTSRLPESVRAYLSTPDLMQVWAAIRHRLERNSLAPTGILLVDLTYQAAEDLSGLLRRPVSEGQVRLSLADLDAALRASAAASGLVAVVADLTGGPLVDRKAAGAAQRASRLGLWESWENALEWVGLQGAPWVSEWQEGVRRTGLLIRAGDAAPLVIEQTMAVLTTLATVLPLAGRDRDAVPRSIPVAPSFELAELASRSCADAHALDDGRVTTALVLRALAAATGEPVPTNAARRRDLWALAGVSPDAVSGTLLVWALRPPGSGRWAAMMRTRADLGVVTHVTLQEWSIASEQPWATSGERVYVCENPQVVQAAARMGTTKPVLCTSGNPATVSTLALDKLVADGADVVYHGDFDVAGVRIAERLFQRGVRPWRFTDRDYLEALASTDSSSNVPFTGDVPETWWSVGLASALRSHRLAVHEEALMGILLSDLT